jgi:hypothetical protein
LFGKERKRRVAQQRTKRRNNEDEEEQEGRSEEKWDERLGRQRAAREGREGENKDG